MEFNLINPIAERKTKTVYRDGDKTIKLFVENYSKADILNEALIQSRVEENTDLKISRLQEVTKINERWALITEYVEGTPLDVLMKEHPEKQDEYLNFFVGIQLDVLSKRVPLLNRIKDKYRRKITDATNIDDTTKYELLQRLEGMKNHDKLCHGDFVPSNIIVKENGEYAAKKSKEKYKKLKDEVSAEKEKVDAAEKENAELKQTIEKLQKESQVGSNENMVKLQMCFEQAQTAIIAVKTALAAVEGSEKYDKLFAAVKETLKGKVEEI